MVSAAPKPKKEKPKGGTKDSEKLVRKLEREIEKQEKLIADLDAKIEASSADYQELTRLLQEKTDAEARLEELMPEAMGIGLLRQKGLTDSAIADSIGVKRTTFLSRLKKAREQLASEFPDLF